MIYNAILSLISKLFNIEAFLLESNDEQALSGDVLGLNGIDLVYLYYAIEKEFGIKIDAKYIEDGSFNSIKGLCTLVDDSLKLKSIIYL